MPFRKRRQPKKPAPKTKPYDREKEGKGKCSECQVVNGHRAGCWKAGT